MTAASQLVARSRAVGGFVLDLAGVGLLAWLGWRVLFATGESFQAMALATGGFGIASALLAGQRLRVPMLLAGYAALGLLSAASRRWDSVPPAQYWTLFEPAEHLVVMVVFVVGVAHLLRTAWRLSLLSVILAGSVCVLSAQTLLDLAITGYEGQPSLQTMVPSVSQWMGVHDLTFMLGVGVPLVLAPGLVFRSWRLLLAGLLLAMLPILASDAVNSRGGTASMVAVMGTMTVATVGGPRLARALPAMFVAAGAFLAIGIAIAILGFGGADAVWTVGGRSSVWTGSLVLVGENPWLGVGPGNYMVAMNASGQGAVHLNAHNLLLHVAAETGVIASGLVFAYLMSALHKCRRAWLSGTGGVASAGVCFVLVILMIRWMTDTFIEGSILEQRHRILAWTVFAAALAVEQLSASGLGSGQVSRAD